MLVDVLGLDNVWEDEHVRRAASGMVKAVRSVKRTVNSRTQCIQLVESHGHTLQEVAASPSTKDMVLTTDARIYVLYPKLWARDVVYQRSAAGYIRLARDFARDGRSNETGTLHVATGRG